MIVQIKQWYNKRKMKKELETQSIFGQIEKAGLNKEEIMFIYDHFKRFTDYNKAEIDKSEKMKGLFKTLEGMGDALSSPGSTGGLAGKVEEMMKKNDEFVDKLREEYKVTNSIVSKLQPLKEIFE